MFNAAGDYVKFGFPMAGAMTNLAWGAIDYRDAYEEAGNTNLSIKNSS